MKKAIKKIIQVLKAKEMVPIIRNVPDSKLLEDKVALIIGGSGGIGMAVAKKIYDAGAKIIIAGTNEKKLSMCRDKIIGECVQEDRLKFIVINLENVAGFETDIKKAVALYSGHPIDILVNAAGVINKHDFFNTTEEEYERIMDINVKGVFFMSQIVGKHMIESNVKGHILNISSASALRPAWTPYQMSKWAIRGFTMGLADTLLPHGIVVNAIGPGPTATCMLGKASGESIYNRNNPSERYATPEEIADLSLYLVSSMGDLVVGDTFYITGGGGTISYHR